MYVFGTCNMIRVKLCLTTLPPSPGDGVVVLCQAPAAPPSSLIVLSATKGVYIFPHPPAPALAVSILQTIRRYLYPATKLLLPIISSNMSSFSLVTSDCCLAALNHLRDHIISLEPAPSGDSEANLGHIREPRKRKSKLHLSTPENPHTFNDADYTDGGYYSADHRCSNSFKRRKKDVPTGKKATPYESCEPPKGRPTSNDADKAEDACDPSVDRIKVNEKRKNGCEAQQEPPRIATSSIGHFYDGKLQALLFDLHNNLGQLLTRERKENRFTFDHADDADDTDDTYNAYALPTLNRRFPKVSQALTKAIELCEDSALSWLKGEGNPEKLDDIETELKSVYAV